MKQSCHVIRDLLPLYHDDVCSEDSKKMVEEHFIECKDCKMILEKMDNAPFDDSLQQEREQVVENYTKIVKRKSFYTGIALASILIIPIIICLIVNLASGHALDWFFIVLTALMVFASLSVVPLIVEEKKFLYTLGTFTLSLILLLATCCLYTSGNWFFVATSGVLLGLSVVFTPCVLYHLPLQGTFAKHKGSLALAVDTVLLFVLLIMCGFYLNSADYWNSAFLIAGLCVLLVWMLFGIIRYTKANPFIKAGICVLLFTAFSTTINGFILWALDGEFVIRMYHANLARWNTDALINANVDLIILIIGCILGVVLLTVGILHAQMKKRNKS